VTKKVSVGLVVLTDISSMGGRVAVLQRRGEFNHEKMGAESYPGACQVTVHGKVEKSESTFTALYREFAEELGKTALRVFLPSALKNLSNIVTEEKEVMTYGTVLPASFLKEVQLNPSSGGLVLLTEDRMDSIQDLHSFDKKEGVTDRRIIAMFPDEKEAVRKAFRDLPR